MSTNSIVITDGCVEIDGIKHMLVETTDIDKCENCSLYDTCVSDTKNFCKSLFGDIALYNKHFEAAKE